MTEARGFIVSAWDELRPGLSRIFATGRLDDGRSFAAVFASPGPAVFVPRAQERSALAALSAEAAEDWEEMDGSPLSRIGLASFPLRRAEQVLASAGVSVSGVDRMRADEALAARGIRGPVLLRGEERPGKRVDVVFVDPEIESAQATVEFRWLALDIETDREGRVVTVSLAPAGEVLFLHERGLEPKGPGIEVFPDESSLLGALSGRIVRLDPDVITGWNVIDFDFKVILERASALGLSFDAGRTDESASFAELGGRKASLKVPGRAVLDAMRLARAGGPGSGARYEDLSLETVSREVLGEGKTVAARGEAKLEELDSLRSRDPDAFCAYCLRDSVLVLRILEATGLGGLTLKRAALTGVSLDLAWTSIPAFERVYGAALRARRVAVPPKSDRRVSGAAGGTVLEARAGLFPRVLVLDFRSLYPSIMRTFNVDPLAYARAQGRGGLATDIVAPNGARFDPRPGVMPELIAEYAAEREKAIAAGDEVAAYVYKILQNSFYGVLGAEGCRYGRTELAGAITSFGKTFLTMSRDFFEARGLSVLYGDTDSVFVLSGKGEDSGYDELMSMGSAAAGELNDAIAQRVRQEYGLSSLLRIRCEKAYARFLIPRLRSETARLKSEAGEGGRGRSKGYAGLLLASDGSSSVEVKGMEAARTDFTPLARRFQLRLLELVFSGADEAALGDFCREEAAAIKRGERDGELVYRKNLRRAVDDYASETPQVRAARLMGWTDRRGRVSYVMTRAGAEPLDARSGAALDYEHYIERQILPIAASIADAVGIDSQAWLAAAGLSGDASQLELDFGSRA